ncbi:hypothetical protein [Magnetovibrio sp.]|uniref:hypothetical protein n=1 Tax=Magnetovibrio sp. TaxID=2024836 RepID=UPI002F9261BA
MPALSETAQDKKTKPTGHGTKATPTQAQHAWLVRGLDQPGGKLPLFDGDGQQVSERTVRSCIEKGWAEPWFSNPLKPDWIVCKLTDDGRAAVA